MIIKPPRLVPSLISENGGRHRSAQVNRCLMNECGILFETSKSYTHRTCLLCRYDNSSDAYRAKVDEGTFDRKAYYAKAQHLEVMKDNKMKALGVKVTNKATPKRTMI